MSRKKLQKIANRFLELELNPVPVKYGTKIPLRKKHHTPISKEEIKEYDFEEIGISTGYASLNLQVLDFDTKNVKDPEEYMETFNSRIPSVLFDKLVIQRTPSGGFHYIFRCDELESSQKLARNKKGEGVIETRALNSYIKCYPSEGYEMTQKTFSDIEIISVAEKRFLFTISKQLDALYLKDVYKRYSKDDIDYLRKFTDYNKDVEIGVGLLTKAGWTKHSENKEWINFTRPNSESGDLHGGYNKEGFVFQTFSTAQDKFITGKGYNNHHLFCELEHDGNYKKGYAILYDEGYGNDDEDDEEEDDIFLSFLSNEIDENIYLDQLRKDEIPQGMSWGWSSLDTNFLLKRNSFNFILGLDNIGKSTLLSSMMVATNLLHNIKWGISSPEVRTASTRRDLIEASAGKKMKQLSKSEYDVLFKKSRDNFHIISNEKHWSIEEILDNGRILFEQYGIDVLLIDPFSFYAGSGNFSDDNEILSKIRVFAEKYCSVIVVDHPFTGFTRIGKDESGYLRLPNKYEISGGNSKANRCDDFISIHRIINHPDDDVRRTMQISVQKVKDKSTGGEPHIDGEWSELIYEIRDGFLGYWDNNGDNPMYQAMVSKMGVRAKLRRMSAEEAFG
jgi:hypothetical protein